MLTELLTGLIFRPFLSYWDVLTGELRDSGTCVEFALVSKVSAARGVLCLVVLPLQVLSFWSGDGFTLRTDRYVGIFLFNVDALSLAAVEEPSALLRRDGKGDLGIFEAVAVDLGVTGLFGSYKFSENPVFLRPVLLAISIVISSSVMNTPDFAKFDSGVPTESTVSGNSAILSTSSDFAVPSSEIVVRSSSFAFELLSSVGVTCESEFVCSRCARIK